MLAASSESVSALLRALSYKQTIHVLSRPQIRTLDNRLASIQVGKRVPVVYRRDDQRRHRQPFSPSFSTTTRASS